MKSQSQGDPEQALNVDDYVLELLRKERDNEPHVIDDLPPSPDNLALVGDLQGVRYGITQALFDKIRGSKWAAGLMKPDSPELEGYQRKYLDQKPEK